MVKETSQYVFVLSYLGFDHKVGIGYSWAMRTVSNDKVCIFVLLEVVIAEGHKPLVGVISNKASSKPCVAHVGILELNEREDDR